MLILALDTTTTAGSAALLRDGGVLHEVASDPSRPQAARLPAELEAILARAGAALEHVDAFAVGTGPGSFTGLRVGVATMQGLAVAMGKPLFGVSALDALARLAAAPRVATWVDAWRGEVYGALYEDGREVAPPTVARPEELLRGVAGRPTVFTGDGARMHQAVIHAALGADARLTDPVAPLVAGAIGALAADAFLAGLRPAPDAIRPLYVRRSDAELARDRSS